MAWLGTWANRIKLTIDYTKVDAALSNFPVLIHPSIASGIGNVDVSAVFDELTSDANRKKIAVTTSDGTTQCYGEIERWDDVNEQAWFHVKAPSVSNSAETILYLYYDSAQADNTTYVGDTGDAVAQNVWDANFKAVYHMAQDPNGDVADAIKDSTGNANHGTPSGSMTTADLVASKVGKGIDFDGTNDKILKSGAWISDYPFTIENICKNIVNVTSGTIGISDYSDAADFAGICINSDNYVQGFINSGAWSALNGTTLISADEWVHIAFTGASTTDRKIYCNGIQENSNANIDVFITDGDRSTIASLDINSSSIFYPGVIDEVRISNVARSAAWIKATYNSLWDSLITFSSPESIPTVVPTTPLTGTLTITSGVTFIPSIEPAALTLTGSLTSGVKLLEPVYIAYDPLTLTGSIVSGVQLIPRTSFSGTLSLLNSLKVGGTLSLVNSLNARITGNLSLVLSILQKIEGTLGLKLTIEEWAMLSGTLSLCNHLLADGDGVSYGEYYFLKSHGL